MGKKLTKKFAAFKDSQLGIRLKNLQAKIAELPVANEAHISPEEKRAVQQIQAFLKLLSIATSKLLIFSDGKIPSYIQLNSIRSEFKNIQNLCQDIVAPKYIFVSFLEGNLAGIMGQALKAKGVVQVGSKEKRLQEMQASLIGLLKKQLALVKLKNVSEGDLEAVFKKTDELKNCLQEILQASDEGKNIRNLCAQFMEIFKNNFLDCLPVEITHPLTHEWAIICLNELLSLPDNLQSLLDFFNPKSLELDLSKIPFFPKIKVQHHESEESKYIFKILIDSQTEEHDLEVYYPQLIQFGARCLAKALSKYYKNFASTVHVQSELVKMDLLYKFLQQESDLGKEVVNAAQSLFDAHCEQTISGDSSFEIKAEFLKRQIEEAEKEDSKIEAELLKINGRVTAYEQDTVQDLLQENSALKSSIATIDTQTIDVRFLKKRLPDVIIGEDIGVIQMRPYLQEITAAKKNSLQAIKTKWLSRKEDLKNECNTVFLTWYKEELKRHQQNNQETAEYTQDVTHFISAMMSKKIKKEHSLEAIQEQLTQIGQEITIAEKYLLKLREHQANFDEREKCPDALGNARPHIIEEIKQIYRGNKQQSLSLMQQLQEILAELASRKRGLEIELDKTKKSKFFAESMLSLNPSKIQEIKAEKIEELEQIKREITHIQSQEEQREKNNIKKEEYINLVLNLIVVIKDDLIFITDKPGEVNSLFTQQNMQQTEDVKKALGFVRRLIDKKQEYVAIAKNLGELKAENYVGKENILQANVRSRQLLRQLLLRFTDVDENLLELKDLLEKILAISIELQDSKGFAEELEHHENAAVFTQTEIGILDNISHLIVEIQNLDTKISRLETLDEQPIEALATEKISIKQDFESVEKKLGNLEDKLQSLREDVEKFPSKNHYSLHLNTLQNLLSNSRAQTTKAASKIREKKLKFTQEKTKQISAKMESFLENIHTLNQLTSPSDTLDILEKNQNQYQDFTISLANDLRQMADLEHDQSSFTNFSVSAAAQEASLQKQILESVENTINHYTLAIKEKRAALAMQFNESKAFHESFKSSLTLATECLLSSPVKRIAGILETFKPVNAEIEKILAATNARVLNLSEEYSSLQATVNTKKGFLGELADRIGSREKLKENFNEILQQYLYERKEKYKFKDFFLNADAVRREEFIQKLNEDLENYAASGESAQLITWLQSTKASFPGYNLASKLNQIVFALKEENKKIPVNYTEAFENLYSVHSGEQAVRILEQLQQTHPEFVNAIKAVHEQLEKLRILGVRLHADNQGDTAIKLAENLQQRLDEFIITHEKNSPSQQSFSEFREEFECLLHSQDDVMCQHETFWKPIVINILAALFTLGIAVGIQLIYSKVTTGRAAFFYDKSERLYQVEQVDKPLEDFNGSGLKNSC
ncbi:hypothetical protein NKV53_03325 [Legionella sp. 27cVA30]|uniref:hypothetical protein n=1 Tax=Legionella sp. 27cVA30 TaxID=2905657 RepID=UPI0020A13D97|nr:hypothetical protein [Legionella sp. 27cVA30]MCP0913397.1 hypothetical protein [Legionella sp. 27cVA30]